jgi:transposase-like protein
MATTKRSTNRPSAEALVAGNRDLMKALMKDALQEVLEAEMTELLGAAPGERTETRNGCSSATRAARRHWWRRSAACTCTRPTR